MQIRRATTEDAAPIAKIYNWYVLNTIITFETDVVSPQEMTKRIHEKLLHHDCSNSHYEFLGGVERRVAVETLLHEGEEVLPARKTQIACECP